VGGSCAASARSAAGRWAQHFREVFGKRRKFGERSVKRSEVVARECVSQVRIAPRNFSSVRAAARSYSSPDRAKAETLPLVRSHLQMRLAVDEHAPLATTALAFFDAFQHLQEVIAGSARITDRC